MRKIMVLPMLVAACVAPHQQALNQAIADCNAGNRYACQSIPALNAQVQAETQQQQIAAGVGAAIVGAALIGAAASGGGGGGPGPRGPGGPGPRGPGGPPHP